MKRCYIKPINKARLFMDELELSALCEKKRNTKKAIEDLKKSEAQRKLEARRKIEDIKIDKKLGLA